MKPLLIVKAGETFPDLMEKYGDFEHWIARGLGVPSERLDLVNAVTARELPGPGQISGAVISGSHAYVTQDLSWSLALEDWTRRLVEERVPLLGICYGHQILARAMGGIVGDHPLGLEIGTREAILSGEAQKDLLFKKLPPRFKVHEFHSQSVAELPPRALLLAGNDFDPHQAFRIGTSAWGVQFHPEARGEITKGYVRNLEKEVRAQGQDPARIIDEICETPHAAALLKGFGDLVFPK